MTQGNPVTRSEYNDLLYEIDKLVKDNKKHKIDISTLSDQIKWLDKVICALEEERGSKIKFVP